MTRLPANAGLAPGVIHAGMAHAGQLPQALGLSLRAAVVADTLEVWLAAPPGSTLPGKVHLLLRDGTRDALDRTMTVAAGGDGSYRMPVPGLPAGHWYLHVETADWRLVDSLSIR